MAVVFSNGGDPIETAAVLLDVNGKLALLREDDELSPAAFDLELLDNDALRKFTIHSLESPSEFCLIDAAGEREQAYSLSLDQHLRLRSDDDSLELMWCSAKFVGGALPVCSFKPGRGWEASGRSPAGCSLIVADSALLVRFHGRLPMAWKPGPTSPRARPSDLAERSLETR